MRVHDKSVRGCVIGYGMVWYGMGQDIADMYTHRGWIRIYIRWVFIGIYLLPEVDSIWSSMILFVFNMRLPKRRYVRVQLSLVSIMPAALRQTTFRSIRRRNFLIGFLHTGVSCLVTGRRFYQV